MYLWELRANTPIRTQIEDILRARHIEKEFEDENETVYYHEFSEFPEQDERAFLFLQILKDLQIDIWNKDQEWANSYMPENDGFLRIFVNKQTQEFKLNLYDCTYYTIPEDHPKYESSEEIGQIVPSCTNIDIILAFVRFVFDGPCVAKEGRLIDTKINCR